MTSEERKQARYQRRKEKRQNARLARSQAQGDFADVFSFRHLYLSGKKCCKGVGWKSSTQRYLGSIIRNTAEMWEALDQERFVHRGFHAFTIMERGKKRHIRAVHISERVVQRCLCDHCLVPIYAPSFIYDNAASLKGKGTDFALNRLLHHLRRHYRKYGWEGYILLYDFKGYFDSAPHEPLFAQAEQRIHDPKICRLSNSFIQDFGEIGLGLGSQVSQTNALLLPSPIDHCFKERLRMGSYGRYMDDGYAIARTKEELERALDALVKESGKLGLTVNRKKTKIIPLRQGLRFLKVKFILTPTGKIVQKMNREATVIFRRKLRSFLRWHREGRFPLEDIRSVHGSYHGHMKRGNSDLVRKSTDRYFKKLFGFYPDKKGWMLHVSIPPRWRPGGHPPGPGLGQSSGQWLFWPVPGGGGPGGLH